MIDLQLRAMRSRRIHLRRCVSTRQRCLMGYEICGAGRELLCKKWRYVSGDASRPGAEKISARSGAMSCGVPLPLLPRLLIQHNALFA